MSLIHLSDMTGCRTLLDWSNGLSSGTFRICQPRMRSESERAALVYFFSQKVSPFSIFCMVHNGSFYLLSGAEELYTMHRFINGKCRILREHWSFQEPFPSKTNFRYWNDVPAKDNILSTVIPVQYAALDNSEDFRVVQKFFKYL